MFLSVLKLGLHSVCVRFGVTGLHSVVPHMLFCVLRGLHSVCPTYAFLCHVLDLLIDLARRIIVSHARVHVNYNIAYRKNAAQAR